MTSKNNRLYSKTPQQKKKFFKINIEISNICNLQCSFCPEVIRSKKIMELSLFENIIQQASLITEQVCLHLMGDPLVHPKLSEIIEICARYKVPIFFVSNGVLIKEQNKDLLLHPIIRQLNFSLHSFFDNFPEKNPDLYLAKIFSLTEKAFAQRPDLYINYRLWNLNDPKGTSTNNYEMLSKIMTHFNVNIDLNNMDVRRNKSVRILNKLYLHYDTEFIWPNLNLPFLGSEGRCYGLSQHFGILADGTVVPCCLDKEGLIPLGDAKTHSLSEILNSETAQNILQGFQNKKLINPLCQRCNYIQRFN